MAIFSINGEFGRQNKKFPQFSLSLDSASLFSPVAVLLDKKVLFRRVNIIESWMMRLENEFAVMRSAIDIRCESGISFPLTRTVASGH